MQNGQKNLIIFGRIVEFSLFQNDILPNHPHGYVLLGLGMVLFLLDLICRVLLELIGLLQLELFLVIDQIQN